eukprot:9152440-Pyramimonas_sp.AAC.1
MPHNESTSLPSLISAAPPGVIVDDEDEPISDTMNMFSRPAAAPAMISSTSDVESNSAQPLRKLTMVYSPMRSP